MENAIYNPKNVPLDDLPTIYGFKNGGQPGWMHAQLLSETGYGMGSHICSSEAYMPYDLGVYEGHRPDRHEWFREEFPDGYKMEFVRSADIEGHVGLQAAFKRAAEIMEKAEAEGSAHD